MRIEPEFIGESVVFQGTFSPMAFTPAWLDLHRILPGRAMENADALIAHDRLASFSTEWLQLHVTSGRIQAATQCAQIIRLHEFMVNVLGKHLGNTQVHALAINREVHFPASGPNAWDRLAKLLAPVGP